MSNIRGKLRQQYIDNWLEGHEDPDVEVKPTRIDGKYIVRYKNLPEPPKQFNPPANTPSEVQDQKPKAAEVIPNNESSDDNSNESSADIPNESNCVAAYKADPAHGGANVQPDIMQEILEQLKIINDERHAKELKKAKKKELQQAIRKEFVRHRVLVEDPDPAPEPTPQTVYIDRPPIKMRRRLDLRANRK